MTKANLRRSCACVALAAGFYTSGALAQSTQPAVDAAASEEPQIIVTGTLIRGSTEDQPAPIDVISSEELAKQGSPSVIDLIKNLPTSNGIIGDANQFDARAQGSEGSGSVNLRGLGAPRTLVLMNGRRMPINPLGQGGAGIVDTNIIPASAIGRLEVLKDGAAATYGSDAVAGVVNFIFKDNFEGLAVNTQYGISGFGDGEQVALPA